MPVMPAKGAEEMTDGIFDTADLEKEIAYRRKYDRGKYNKYKDYFNFQLEELLNERLRLKAEVEKAIDERIFACKQNNNRGLKPDGYLEFVNRLEELKARLGISQKKQVSIQEERSEAGR